MQVTVIRAAWDSGHYETGLGAGPDAILAGGLIAALTAAGHGAELVDIGRLEDSQPREIATGFAVCRAVALSAAEALAAGRFPVTLAGNCLTAAGAIAGESAEALVWFDQHGDINTPETSPSGFLDGMALAVTCGLCWVPMAATIPGFRPIDPARIVLVDARDLDSAEHELLARLPIRHVTCEDLVSLSPFDPGPTHLHIDLDVHDPAELRVNRYATPGGPSPDTLRSVAMHVARRTRLSGLTISAYDPASDAEGLVAKLVGALVLSILDAAGGPK
jgi:arginase